MKKIFAILTIVSFLAACNNNTETATTTTDTVLTESPLNDAVNVADSASKIIEDSTGKMMDTIIKK